MPRGFSRSPLQLPRRQLILQTLGAKLLTDHHRVERGAETDGTLFGTAQGTLACRQHRELRVKAAARFRERRPWHRAFTTLEHRLEHRDDFRGSGLELTGHAGRSFIDQADNIRAEPSARIHAPEDLLATGKGEFASGGFEPRSSRIVT